MSDRERTWTLFGFLASAIVFLWAEIGRRQSLTERREEHRREWVDDQIGKLNDGQLGHRERSEGVRNIGRLLVGAATVIVGVIALVTLLASHAIG